MPTPSWASLPSPYFVVVGWWQARSAGDLDRMARVLWAGGGALVALGLNQLIEGVVDRARPYAALSDVHVLVW